MKIYFAETGHMELPEQPLDYSALRKLGELTLGDIRDPKGLCHEQADAEILIVGRLPLTSETLSQFRRLRLIVKAGTGVDKIDLGAARARGISVSNLPGYAARPVGQATMAFILSFASSLPQYDREARSGRWREAQFTHPMILLAGKRLGIVGLGGIARRVVELARALELQVQLYTRYPDPMLDVEYVDLETLAATSDFISVHCALDAHTRGLIGAKFLSRVKSSVYLVNTARAAVIDEDAVIEALREKRIAGLGMDGFWREPPEAEHELLRMPNVLITPHITWAPFETRQRMIDEMATIVSDFVGGIPRNVVN